MSHWDCKFQPSKTEMQKMTSTPDLELFEKETSLDILSLFTLIQRRKFKIFISIFFHYFYSSFFEIFFLRVIMVRDILFILVTTMSRVLINLCTACNFLKLLELVSKNLCGLEILILKADWWRFNENHWNAMIQWI